MENAAAANAAVNSAIGRAVKVARIAKGWTQERLAAAVGLGQSDLTRLERGQQLWSGPMVLRVAEQLGVPVDLLYPASDAADSPAVPTARRAS